MVNQSIIDTAKRLIQSIPESIEIKKAFWLALILKGMSTLKVIQILLM